MLKLKYLFENFALAKECIRFYEYSEETLDEMLPFFRISSNAIYPFRAGENAQKVCFLRISPIEEKSFEDVVTEISLIESLIEKGFSAMKPVPMKDGERAKQVATEWGKYNVSCFEKVPGKSLEDVAGTLDIVKGYGHTLGKMHALLKEYPAQEDRRDHKELLKEIRERLEMYEAPKRVNAECASLSRELEKLEISKATYGVIHYDFEPDNVFYDAESGLFSVIDFDDAIRCWYALDVVRALDALDEIVEEDMVKAAEQRFMEGYRSATDFTEEQQKSLHLMRRLVYLQEYATILHVISEPILEMPDWMHGLMNKLIGKLHWLEETMSNGNERIKRK